MSAKVRALEVFRYDNRNRLRSTTIANPPWAAFLNHLENVRGGPRRPAGVILHAEDGSRLVIDGSDGLHYALYELPDGSQYQPLDLTHKDEEVTILCGGVETPLPRACLLNEPGLLPGARQFWNGNVDTSSGWESL
jgi:hypothetical protein